MHYSYYVTFRGCPPIRYWLLNELNFSFQYVAWCLNFRFWYFLQLLNMDFYFIQNLTDPRLMKYPLNSQMINMGASRLVKRSFQCHCLIRLQLLYYLYFSLCLMWFTGLYTQHEYRTCAIISRSWFEATLVYKPLILSIFSLFFTSWLI